MGINDSTAPAHWNFKSIGDDCTLKARIGWQALTTNEYLTNGSHFLVTGTDFDGGKIVWESCWYISEWRYKQDPNIQLRENDVLITKDGTIGKVGYVSNLSLPAALNSGVFVIRPKQKNDIHAKFLYYILSSQIFTSFLKVITAGSTITHLYQKDFVFFKFLAPKFDEQKRIAESLADVDELIINLEKLIAKKRQIKQGAMQAMLHPFDKKGELKAGWCMTSYGEAFDFMSTAAYSRAELGGCDCGYVHYGDIHTEWDSHLDLKLVELPAVTSDQAKPYTFLKEGDLIMADASEDYNGIGKSVEVVGLEDRKVIAGLHTFLLRSREGYFANGFKGYIHQIPNVKKQLNQMATGLKVYGVSKNNLKNISIPRPPEEEQENIKNVLRDMDNEILKLIAKVTKTRELKRGMMQALLTGKIRLVEPAK